MTGSWVRILTEAEWEQARRGKVTASEFHEALVDSKKSVSRDRYAGRLITQRLGGQSTNGFLNDAMRWGIATEPQAIRAYQEKMQDREGVLFRAPDGHRLWVEHPTIAGCAATPDALYDEGIVEIKCPYESYKHLKRYDDQTISDSDYRVQVQFQLLCMPEREWVDLVSYDPRMPDHMQLVIRRTYRSEITSELAKLEAQADKFVHEVDERVAKYMQRNEQ